MKNYKNPDHGNGHGKSLIWSWKVTHFYFQDFVGTLIQPVFDNFFVKQMCSKFILFNTIYSECVTASDVICIYEQNILVFSPPGKILKTQQSF